MSFTMAEADHNDANGAIAKLMDNDCLRCPVCEGEFNSPKILPCLHTFCCGCLENSLTQSQIGPGGAFLCPLCRQQTFVPMNGVSAFRDNIFYITLQEFSDRKALDQQQKCEACDSGARAKRQCLECNDWLCSKCCAMHQKVKVTKDHHLLSPKDLHSGEFDDMIKSSFEPLMCSKHGEPLKLFCTFKACQAPICTVCKTTLGHDHHAAIELSAQALKERKTIKDYLPNLQRSIINTSAKIANLKHEDKCTSHVRKKVHKALNDRVSQITQQVTQQIQEYAENIRQEVDKIVKEHKVEVSKELEEAEYNLKAMMMARSFTDSLLKFNRPEELVTMSPDVNKRLQEYQKPVGTEPPGWRQPRLYPAEDIDLDTMTRIFGTLTFEGEVIKTVLLRTFPAKLDDDERSCALCDITIDDEENLLLVDRDNRRIKSFDLKGNVRICSGPDSLRSPNRIVYLHSTGRLLVKDEKYLKLINKDGTFVSNFAEHLKQPVGLASNRSGEVLVTDWMSGAVHVFDELGGPLHNFPHTCEAPGYVTASPEGHVIISDWKQHVVRVYDAKGNILNQYGEHGAGAYQLDHPYGVCTDKYGHILIADTWNNRIHMLSTDGRFIRMLLTKEDGLNYPQAVAVNKKGHLIIVEQHGNIKIYQYMA